MYYGKHEVKVQLQLSSKVEFSKDCHHCLEGNPGEFRLFDGESS